jgi:predicted secreted hydrolase
MMSRSMIAEALGVVVGGILACSSDSDPTKPMTAGAGGGTGNAGFGGQAGWVDGGGQCSSSMPTGRVALPADDSSHPSEGVEWWYWTGHLKTDDGRWFGFEEVFFRAASGSSHAQKGHRALSDITDGTFHFASASKLGEPEVVANGFSLSLDGMTAQGGDGHDQLHMVVDTYTLDLNLTAAKRAVWQHEDGYTDYSLGGYTYYYSRERMNAVGTLTVDGKASAVTGTAWFDHQYGDLAKLVDSGWDWFAIQLDDGRDIMLFVSRNAGKRTLVGGSYSDANCATVEIGPDAYSVTPLEQWKSSRSNCTYPSGWTVNAAGLTLTVTPVLKDQELHTSTSAYYWEGAAEVRGSASGRAYVELTGYCP